MLVTAVLFAQSLQPVRMVQVEIGPARPISGGRVQEISVEGQSATLFIPDGWLAQPKNRIAAHFHSPAWYVVSQFQQTGLNSPVVTFNFGQGSTVYAGPFKKPGSFAEWLSKIESVIGGKVGQLVVTSYSAGYGAVRELVSQPAFLDRLETLVLSDSMYGSFAPEGAATRTVEPDHAKVWMPLAERAIAGKATVVITCSAIHPEAYAGTDEVSSALVKLLGGEMKPATLDGSDQPLQATFDLGRLFVWHYGGNSPEAHMTHARRAKDILIQLYPKP